MRADIAARLVQYHVGRVVHPMLRDQIQGVPAGFEYRYTHPALADASVPTPKILARSSLRGKLFERAQTAAVVALSEAGYVRRSKLGPLPGAELVHSVQFLLKDVAVPYVVDFEHPEVFGLYQGIAFRRPWARARLRRAVLDGSCRFLLPWSEAARRALLRLLGPEAARRVEAKTEAVLPCIRPLAERPRERGPGPLRVLFSGTRFLQKGGAEAVLALSRVRESHDVELDLIAYAPAEWRQRIEATDGIRLPAPVPADRMRELYTEADALLFPTHMDTLGYVLLEAMSNAMPVVGPEFQAVPELIGAGEGAGGLMFPHENHLFGSDGLSAFRHSIPPPRGHLRALGRPSGATWTASRPGPPGSPRTASCTGGSRSGRSSGCAPARCRSSAGGRRSPVSTARLSPSLGPA